MDRSTAKRLFLVLALVAASFAGACVPDPPEAPPAPLSVSYTTFFGATLQRQAYLGTNVALLVPPDGGWNGNVVRAIVTKLDVAYDYYRQITGREPTPYFTIEGRASIAVVPSTCGAGCGYPGSTGIELQTSYWETLYDGVNASGVYDQPLFYELGRNFWFLGAQLAYQSPDDDSSVMTGFAVLNRFTSMDTAGATGGPFGAIPFATFRNDVRGLVDSYEANATLTWANTLKIGRGIPGSYLGSTDLFASFVMRLGDYFGTSTIYDHIWREAALLPAANTTQKAVDNFVLAASAAAGRNLTRLFSTTWRFPVSAGARATAQTRWGNPWVRP